jgi:hypothetical protein
MQLLVKGGSTGLVDANVTPARDVALTPPVLAAGLLSLSGQVYIPAGYANTFRAELIYRFFTTDEETSAAAWVTTGSFRAGPGKSRVTANVASVDGLMVQLGLRITDTAGASSGEAMLQHVVLVTT